MATKVQRPSSTSERHVELLGQLAVQQKLVTADQLKLCLAEQSALRKTGRLVPLGQILVQRRFLTGDQIQGLLLNQKGVPPQAPLVNRKYALVRKLGRGGAGDVYLARDTALDRPVAIKILREEMAVNRKAVQRFLREARVLAKLRHPNVVGVHETGEYEGRPYFVMDYVDGTALDVAMAPGAMPMRKKVQILAQVAGAVGELHRHGVVHRDLKPSNVIIDGTGNPILLDFGLAHDVSRRTKLTVTGTILGTPFYMAPEQVEGKAVDSRTDVYALGVVLYEMLTGHLPFRVENEFELYRQISSHEPPNPSTIERRVPRDLEIICLKAMEKDRAARYPNATEFAEDLRRFLEGQPIKARPTPLTVKLWRRIQQHRIASAAIAGSLVVALVVGTVLLVGSLKTSGKVNDLLRSAEQHFQNGELAVASGEYQRVQGMDPDNRTAREGLAKVAERSELIKQKLTQAATLVRSNPEEAVRIYESILALDRRNSAGMSGLESARRARSDKKRRTEDEDFLQAVRDRIQKFQTDVTMPWRDYLALDPSKPLADCVGKIRPKIDEMDDDFRAEAHFLLGRIFGYLGKTAESQMELDEAIRTAPRPQGRYFYARGNLALSNYRREYARVTQDARREGKKDALESLKGLRESAQRDFQEAVKLGVGEGWETVYARAVVEYTEGRLEKALEACKTLQDRREAAILKLLGQIALDLTWSRPDRCREAIEYFGKAAEIYRSDPEAHTGLADAYYEATQYEVKLSADPDALDRVIEEYDIAIRLQPAASSYIARGQAKQEKCQRLLILGRDAHDVAIEAQEDMATAVRMDQTNPNAHNMRGIAHIQGATVFLFRASGFDAEAAEEQIEQAIFAVNQAIKIDPRGAGFYHNRAVARGVQALLRMMGGGDAERDLEDAMADLKKTVELGNRGYSVHEAKASIHLWKCVHFLSQGQTEPAGSELQESIAECDVALGNPVPAARARMIMFRGALKMIRGLQGFLAWNRDVCIESLRGATQDLREAVRLHPGITPSTPDAFDSIRKAMELQFDKKDPKAEYRTARDGLTKVLGGGAPADSNAHVFRLSSLLLRGFACYYLEDHGNALKDWDTLCKQIPPFKVLLAPWIEVSKQKVQDQQP